MSQSRRTTKGSKPELFFPDLVKDDAGSRLKDRVEIIFTKSDGSGGRVPLWSKSSQPMKEQEKNLSVDGSRARLCGIIPKLTRWEFIVYVFAPLLATWNLCIIGYTFVYIWHKLFG